MNRLDINNISKFRNGRALVNALDAIIVGYYDADLWNDPSEYNVYFDPEEIVDNAYQGYISLYNVDKKEVYYHNMPIPISRKDFDLQGIVSPASNKKWSFSDVLRKLRERSIIRAERNAFMNFSNKYIGNYGDMDLTVTIKTFLKSVWTDSPSIELKTMFPLHITQNGNIEDGFFSGIDYNPETERKNFGGVVAVTTEKENVIIQFTYDELNNNEIEQISDFIIKLVSQRIKKVFLSDMQKNK